jgi:hypothetical protein
MNDIKRGVVASVTKSRRRPSKMTMMARRMLAPLVPRPAVDGVFAPMIWFTALAVAEPASAALISPSVGCHDSPEIASLPSVRFLT